MAAPIYTQAQVAAMIATPKYVPHDAWNGRSEGREGTDEVRNRIEAHPIDENDPTQFLIERCRCAARGEASFTLFGRLAEYVQQPLCRYEIQICRHSNPKWFSGPSYISARVPHKHVYNERAILEGWTWDKCAEPLKLNSQPKKKLSVEQCINWIAPIFLKEIHLEIHDPESNGLFGR